MFLSIQKSKIWQKWQDLILVLLVTFGLIGLYVLLHVLDDQDWTLVTSDGSYFSDASNSTNDYTYSMNETVDFSYLNTTNGIDYLLSNDSSGNIDSTSEPLDFSNEIKRFISITTSVVIALSLFTTPIAAYFSATNDRLSWPIRLLATAENLNKFIYALSSAFNDSCGYLGICSDELSWTFSGIYWLLFDTYPLCDVAQYCQCLISLSRFLVLSFEGAYFRYTTKLPIVQLLFPYALRIALSHIEMYLINQELYDCQGIVHEFCVTMPYFLTCGLDFVTNRKVKLLKKHGKASRVECLLMIQMVTNSCLTMMNFILYYILSLITYLFFGYDVWAIFWKLRSLNQALLFNLIASTISVLFLRKPKERPPRGGRKLTVTSIGHSSRHQ